MTMRSNPLFMSFILLKTTHTCSHHAMITVNVHTCMFESMHSHTGCSAHYGTALFHLMSARMSYVLLPSWKGGSPEPPTLWACKPVVLYRHTQPTAHIWCTLQYVYQCHISRGSTLHGTHHCDNSILL